MIKGIDEALRSLDKMTKELETNVDNAVRVTGLETQAQIKASINKPSAGDYVTRYEPKRKHRASKEGDAPNTDLGGLIGSIMMNHKKGSKKSVVFSALDYALHLETVHNRPFMLPAAEAQQEPFLQRLKEALKL